MKKFYITTAIPYVNAPPHMGHALEFVQVDAAARYHRMLGETVQFTTGSDENALKNVQAAEKLGITPQTLCDKNTQAFQDLMKLLDISYDNWQRGSDKELHRKGVEKLWRLCAKNGDLYKKSYQGLYCVGCESFVMPKDLVDGKCPYHGREPEAINEENYFFRLSKYQKQIENLIRSETVKIFPQKRKREILSFIEEGLADFSISRSRERAKNWGIPVPDDPDQVIYVWFDALAIYMTAIGFGMDEKKWKEFWPTDVHVIGKDIIRFHAVYWLAMLLSAGLPLPKSILVHGFITAGGQKMSKTLGNIIDPHEVIANFGSDALRYYLLKEIPTQDDGDFTLEHFKEVYNGDLANGIGNFVARVAKLCQLSGYTFENKEQPDIPLPYKKAMEEFRFNETLVALWSTITGFDKLIDREKPWELLRPKAGQPLAEKTDDGNLPARSAESRRAGEAEKKAKEILEKLVAEIRSLGVLLGPFMPQTAAKIKAQFGQSTIASDKPLFPRL